MGQAFYDPRTKAVREFKPAAPPRVGVDAAPANPREAALAAALERALTFLGLRPEPGRDVRVGGADPGPAAAWLSAAELEGEDPWRKAGELERRGFAREDFEYLCLTVHYRRPLPCSWARLAEIRAERAGMLAAARDAAGVTLAAHPAALSGYLQRFRSELARDLDLPGALACVRDGLRPGALSPGSRAALVREAFPALGLAPAPAGGGH